MKETKNIIIGCYNPLSIIGKAKIIEKKYNINLYYDIDSSIQMDFLKKNNVKYIIGYSDISSCPLFQIFAIEKNEYRKIKTWKEAKEILKNVKSKNETWKELKNEFYSNYDD